MKKQFKIVLVNNVFTQKKIRYRWEIFAEEHKDIDLYLISPNTWHFGGSGKMTTGGSETQTCEKIDSDNYHVIPVDYKIDKMGDWVSDEISNEILKIKPDLVYHIGTHLQTTLFPILKTVKKNLPKTKIAIFSMRGPNYNILYKWREHPIKSTLRFLYRYNKVRKINKSVDAVLCHYPDALTAFRAEGFKRPIYMCTQVGVNTDDYQPNSEARDEIRKKFNLGNSFVFGSATRFSPDKGLDDIIDALPDNGNWKYLMMGGGRECDVTHVKEKIRERGLENKIILTGLVEQGEMCKYWNAIDCALHTPRTAEWIETFSLALVQAMASGKPIIGSDSGSVPYQIGYDEMIVPECNPVKLREKIEWVINNPSKAEEIGQKMKMRAEKCFSIKHLNDCIYDIFIDIINERYDDNKIDQAKYLVD